MHQLLKNKHLHIVCLDVPFPPDYGGAIDMFYKIKTLYERGIKIHLHYFSYNHRGNPNELNGYCESIHYYERKTGHKSFSFDLPYIVSSRINNSLIENLNKDNHPVLLEGIHCSGIAGYIQNGNRKILIRLHNDESAYYRQLADAELRFLKKLYYRNESRLLQTYQQSLPKDCFYAAISEKDIAVFNNHYHIKNTIHLPAFIPYTKVESQEGIGNFCLYHGNLSIPENEKAVTWLLQKIFSKIKIPLVVAGKKPTQKLQKMVKMYENICLIADPSNAEMEELVQKAQINVIPSFNSTGVKLKVLQAVFSGRHCIVNEAAVAGSGIEPACHIAANADAMASIIMQLYRQPFAEEEILLRRKMMHHYYDNNNNAETLIALLW
ncbi:MAG: glycosyltransferase [Chitinophagaceae bacterium]|jgi:glycosyltransferase involved in cell wall biosynthesis|nr:glycosyltransferase [Chitinophagaceae bacterium]